MSDRPDVHPIEVTKPGDTERHFEFAETEIREVVRWVSARRHVELTLYGAITLLAAILAFRVSEYANEPNELIAVIWASAVGLGVAHWFAASVAGRVSSPEPLPLGHYVGALIQSYPLLIGGLVASIGALIGGTVGDSVQAAARGADIALISLCAGIAWAGASVHSATLRRKFLLTTFVVVFASFIAGAKFLLGH
jgi:hypothetical protein